MRGHVATFFINISAVIAMGYVPYLKGNGVLSTFCSVAFCSLCESAYYLSIYIEVFKNLSSHVAAVWQCLATAFVFDLVFGDYLHKFAVDFEFSDGFSAHD